MIDRIGLRVLAYLKRITLALESLASAHGTPTPRPRRHTEFSMATTEALNAKWERDKLAEYDDSEGDSPQ